VFNTIENIDVFKIMELIGIEDRDRLYCLDLIQTVRNEVMRIKFKKDKKR